MIEALLPANESLRLEALRQTRLLDTPLEERFERITRLAQRALGMPLAVLSLVDADRQWAKSVQGSNMRQTPRRIAFCAHAILQDQLLEVPDARIDQRFHDNPLVTGDPHVAFYAGWPVKAGDNQNVGVFCVMDQKPRILSPGDRQTLRDLAAIIESEMHESLQESVQKELLDQLDETRRQSQLDPLTRIWNRDAILELCEAEIARGRRHGGGVGVILADLDFFKQVNDSRGHAAGDEVLRQAAKRMLGAIRQIDALGRYGGEEFLIVLSDCRGLPDAQAIAERMRTRVCESPVPTEFGDIPLTASFGAAYVHSAASASAPHVVRMADQALYAAKRAGRNRTVGARL